MSEKRTNPLVIVIVCGIFALLLAVVLVVGLRLDDPSPTERAPKAPPRDLTAGQTITRDEMIAQGSDPVMPSASVDNTRIAATYKQGNTYKTKIKTKIDSRGTYADWGVTTDSNMVFVGEFEIFRDIESNSGDKLVIVQEFSKIECLELFTQVDNISFNLSNTAHTVLDIGGAELGIPPGSSRIAVNTLNKVLSSDLVKDWVAEVERDEAAKLFTEISTLNGKKCRIIYENGVGVTSIEPIGCTLSEEEYSLIMDTAVISDIYLMPDEECAEGDTWEVRGEDFLPIVDPSLPTSLSGTLTIRRGKDAGGPSDPGAIIRLERGVLDLHSRDDKTEVAAKWAPRGELEYSFNDGIVTSGRLTGDLSLVASSLDHVIFQMKNVVTPKYEVTYHCEIVE